LILDDEQLARPDTDRIAVIRVISTDILHFPA